MGFSARAPASDTTIGVVEAFDVPDDVVISPPDGILEVSVTPPSRSALFASSTESIFVRVTDGIGVATATINATVSNGGSLTFRNDGVSPDVSPNNSVYSASFNVPTNTTSVTITLVISAPGKVNSTNLVQYDIIPLPTNDNFADSIKVPTSGAIYVSNNRFATTELNEPFHANVTNSAASLWWTWASGFTTNVLVDTGTSLFDTVVAVYTGSQLSALTRVASANDIGTRRQAFVIFQAQAGVTYKIAVASAARGGTGTLHLRVAPGGLPDTSAPVVTVTSPLNGFVFSTNRIVISGTAVDPQPDPSGINRILISSTSSLNPEEVTEVVLTNRPVSALDSTNWSQTIAIAEGLNTIRVTATDIAGNISQPATLQVNYLRLDPPNDLFINAIALTGGSGVKTANTLNAGKESGEPDHAGNAGGKSAWWTFTPTNDGILTLSTTNSTFDTVLGIYLGSRVNTLTPVASDDDAYEGVSFSKITQAVRSNQVYRIAVDGFNGAFGVVFLSYSFAVSNINHLTINTIENGTVVPGTGDYPHDSTVVLSALPGANYEFVAWEGDIPSAANPLSIVVNTNYTLTARFRAHVYTDGFESGTLPNPPWSAAGSQPWLVQSSVVSFGQFAARSGAITHSQFSSLIRSSLTGAGVGSFDYKVSSETNWDWLEFYLNGSLLQRWSGESGWATYQFAVPAGTNRFEWRYVKDPSNSAGQDAAFIDNLDLPPVLVSLRLLNATVGGFQVQFQGPASQSVRIQGSSNLATWQDISSIILSNGAVFQFTDPQTPYPSYRFYRAVSP